MATLSPALWEAYRRTTYFAGESDQPRRFALRVGDWHPDLDRWLAERLAIEEGAASDWAFITACNPLSQPGSPAENANRQRRLEERLRQLGVAFLPGEGVADDGRWPVEPSVLAYGIDADTACELGRSFQQFAILAGRRGEPARLMACIDASP
jgi:hypothetical protein